MAKFNLSSHTDSNKVFLVNRADLSGRLDPFYYQPEIAELEKRIKKISNKKLRDYIIRISSGATPSVKEEEKYYSDKENGIPFLRVQNLQTNSELSLDDVKYINKETYEGVLRRSQVEENNLLVKITGVGRMAIASVAPKNFIGNTNQHIVVIKTASEEVSRYLANFLNLDITEKLASRRATGGTRPALDYPALKSIPIVEGIDFNILEEAEKRKKELDIKAEKLLNSIDDYLLGVLGITMPKRETSLKNRIFTVHFKDILGKRFDPNYNSKLEYLLSQKASFNYLYLKDLIEKAPQYGANEEAIDGNSNSDIRYIRITDIDELGVLKKEGWKTARNINKQYLLNYNDLLFARSGSVGRCYIHKETSEDAIFAGYLIRFVINNEKVNPDFLFYYCNSKIYKFWVSAIERPAVQSNINAEEFKSLPIPLPPLKKQNKIAKHIQNIRQKAKDIQTEGEEILEEAKQKIEQMILNS